MKWGGFMAVPPCNSSELVAGRWILPGLCPDSELLLFFFLFVCFGWLAVVVVLVWGSVRQIFIFFSVCVCVWRARRGEPAWIVAQVIRECPAQCNYSLTVTGFISLGIWKCLGFRVGLKGSPKASFPLIKVQNLCQTSQSRVQLPPYPQYISTC